MTKTSSPTVQQSSLPNGRPRIEERVDGVIKPGQLPLSSAVDSTREDVAATSLAVKKTYDEATKKGTLKQAGNVQLCNEFIEDDTKAATPSLAKKANDLAQDALDKANEATDKAEEALASGGLSASDVIVDFTPYKEVKPYPNYQFGPGNEWIEEDPNFAHINHPLLADFHKRWKFKKGYKYLYFGLEHWKKEIPPTTPSSEDGYTIEGYSFPCGIKKGGDVALAYNVCIRLKQV